jgi:hypothetical protein
VVVKSVGAGQELKRPRRCGRESQGIEKGGEG